MKEFDAILKASRNSSLTIFVGAGVSALSYAPSWKKLIKDICDSEGFVFRDDFCTDDLLRIAQMFRNKYTNNDDEYYSILKEKLNVSNLYINDIHRRLVDLDPASFITTNFDDLLEKATLEKCRSYTVIHSNKDVPSIKGNRFILKAHGDLYARNIVFTEEDYLNYSNNFQLIENVMKSLFSMNTILFIGYGLNDYNIKLILNWSKHILKDRFNKPIFFYTGDDKLSDQDLQYQENRGLSIVDWHQCTPLNGNNYLDRYQAIFNVMDYHNRTFLVGSNHSAVINYIYDRLKPLDSLSYVRAKDIDYVLYDILSVSEDGYLKQNVTSDILQGLDYYLGNREFFGNKADLQSKDQLNCICSVLGKASLFGSKTGSYLITRYPSIQQIVPDPSVIQFDYDDSAKGDSLELKYTNAYKLARKRKLVDSIHEFEEVASKAFDIGNYLMAYFSELNVASLSRLYKKDTSMPLIDLKFKDSDADIIFDRMPEAFRLKYPFLKGIGGAVIATDYICKPLDYESGINEGMQLRYRIRQLISFYICNGLYFDWTVEFRSSVRYLMSKIINVYCRQLDGRKLDSVKHNISDPFAVSFDAFDFYCLVEYVDYPELVDMLESHNLNSLIFIEKDKIEKAAFNLFDFALKTFKDNYNSVADKIYVWERVKSCIEVLSYINVSDLFIERFLDIFKDIVPFESWYIINRFLYRQFVIRKKSKPDLCHRLEDIFIVRTRRDLENINNPVNYSNGFYDYLEVMQYLYPLKNYVSKSLSSLALDIIHADRIEFVNHLSLMANYLDEDSKVAIKKWGDEIIENNPSRIRADHFLSLYARINVDFPDELINIARNFLLYSESSDYIHKSEIISMADKTLCNSYYTILGYLVFDGRIKRDLVASLVGRNMIFDLFWYGQDYNYANFDIKEFCSLDWFYIEALSEDEHIRKSLGTNLLNAINSYYMVDEEYELLKNIYIRYFC